MFSGSWVNSWYWKRLARGPKRKIETIYEDCRNRSVSHDSSHDTRRRKRLGSPNPNTNKCGLTISGTPHFHMGERKMSNPATRPQSIGNADQSELPYFSEPNEEGIEIEGQGVELEDIEGDSAVIDEPFDPMLIKIDTKPILVDSCHPSNRSKRDRPKSGFSAQFRDLGSEKTK